MRFGVFRKYVSRYVFGGKPICRPLRRERFAPENELDAGSSVAPEMICDKVTYRNRAAMRQICRNAKEAGK